MSKPGNTQLIVNTIASRFLKNPSPHGLTVGFYHPDNAHVAAQQLRGYAQILSMLSGREVVEKTMSDLVTACLAQTVMVKSNIFSDKSKIFLIVGDQKTDSAQYQELVSKATVQTIAYKVHTHINEVAKDIGSLVLGMEMHKADDDLHFLEKSWVPNLDRLRFCAAARFHFAGDRSLVYSHRDDKTTRDLSNVDFTSAVSVPAVLNTRACDNLQTL